MADHSTMKLGKRSAKKDMRTLLFRRYAHSLAPAPSTYGLASKITSLGMMDNDKYGDCTCAAIGHVIQAWTAELGHQVIVPDSEILALYSAITGFKAGDPSTDQGAVELDVLNYWRKNGALGTELTAFTAIDSKVPEDIKDAVYYFGAAYVGVALPITAQSQDVWDVVGDPNNDINSMPDSWGGHAIPIVDYNETGPVCITWGALKQMTWAWLKVYCDEAYALISPTMFLNGKSVENFDMQTLLDDLKVITS